MASNLLKRYIWIVDTIKRLGRISSRELDRRWANCPYANGESRLPRRTFYNYRQAIEELFSVTILCDQSTKEYYIAEEPGSAREHLSTMLDAVRESRVVSFDYHPYSRVNPNRGVELEPWFLRLYRQIWYVTGREVSSGKDKTYALDRISDLQILPRQFRRPADCDPKSYFKDAYGIMVDKGEARTVVLKVDSRQAKYLRALPLHPSQQEEVNDNYSHFTYRVCLTSDFVSEIISMGSQVTVESPRELRAMVTTRLRETLANYPEHPAGNNQS